MLRANQNRISKGKIVEENRYISIDKIWVYLGDIINCVCTYQKTFSIPKQILRNERKI